MSVLNRVTTFTTGTTISSTNMNAELDQLVAILNGTGVATTVHISGTGAGESLIVNNSGTGKIASFTKTGSEKLRINNTGVLESLIATGTAPFIVASTTRVDNLNAHYLGGELASNYPKLDQSNTFVVNGGWNEQELESDTASQIMFHDTAAGSTAWPYQRMRSAAKLIKFQASPDNSTWTDIARLNATTSKLQVDQSVGGNNWSDVASVAYVESKKTAWSFGVFYAGGIDTSIVQAAWVVPNDVDVITLDRVRYVYQSGTPTGTSQIKLWHLNSSGVSQNTQVVSIFAANTVLNSYQLDITDWTLAQGDILYWTVIADGGHQDISIHAQGVQSLI
jgi:hypothetical protein